ncbi:uncharacterized protein LOC143280153 [Babylonia areolata]|uniref:uncharacterized protein LOC143280153 n=1 Tax=Babylonia areolata TaxID=304850 RepID=UPI003FD39217
MSQTGYDLLRASTPKYYKPAVDRTAPVSLMNRIAIVAIERFILMMNNTLLLTRNHRLANIYEVVDYLLGNHDDVGCNGDRGDFYRRKLAEQIYVYFGVHYVTHDNVINLVRDAIQLESDTRLVLAQCGLNRTSAPPIQVDDQVLDVLARIADMH